MARGDADGDVRAFRFGHTESFGHPVPKDLVDEMFLVERRKIPPLSLPTRISSELFSKLYKLGMGLS